MLSPREGLQGEKGNGSHSSWEGPLVKMKGLELGGTWLSLNVSRGIVVPQKATVHPASTTIMQ